MKENLVWLDYRADGGNTKKQLCKYLLSFNITYIL